MQQHKAALSVFVQSKARKTGRQNSWQGHKTNRQNLKTRETKVKTKRNCSDKKCYTTDQEDKANWQLGEGQPGLHTEGGATRHTWDTDETLPKVEQVQREQVKPETLQEDET